MLEALQPLTFLMTAYRFATNRDVSITLSKMSLSRSQITDILLLLQSRNRAEILDRLLDEPFSSSIYYNRYRRRSRFSNGSYPVLYGSLEKKTSETEVLHWFLNGINRDSIYAVHYYHIFSFKYIGLAADLRPMHAEWPDLTHPDDYSFCNRLGAEAVVSGLEAFITPSARHPGGSCLPVFKRRAVSSPKRIAHAAFSIDAASGNVSITYAE